MTILWGRLESHPLASGFHSVAATALSDLRR